MAAFALFALAPLAPLACSNASKTEATSAPVVAVLEPIPAPPGLLAEISIPSPEATWKEARAAIGGPALFMPQSIGGFLSAALGLPITVAGEFDGNLPALGAIIDAPSMPQPYAALGVHVRVGERLVDQLTKGEGARFVAKTDAATGIVSLEAKGTVKAPVAMGVLGNYLLFGRDLADLNAAGPYIARTLAKSPRASKEDVALDLPDAALAGPIRAALKRVSDGYKGSSAAVAPLLPLDRAAEKLLEIVPDLARARVSIDLDGPALRVRVAGSPRPGGGPATAAIQGMTVGDVAPLRGLPSDTLVAFLDRMSLTGGGAAPRSEPAAGSAFAKLSKDDRDALYAAIDAVNEARGPFLAGGMSFGSTGPLGYVRAGAPDEERLTKALREFVAVLKRPSVGAWIEAEGFALKSGKAVIDGVAGDVQRLTIARVDAGDAERGKPGKGAASDKGSKRGEGAKNAKSAKDSTSAKSAEPDASAPPSGEVPRSIDVIYSVRKEGLFAAAGYRSGDGFAGLLASAAAPSSGFGDSPLIKAALDGLGGDVAFALVADPLKLIASRAGKPGAGDSAPLVVALGHGAAGDELWLRVDVAITVIQELVKHRGALSF